MHDEAVAWAEAILDEPVVEVAELSGGLTSTMLALSHRSRERSVLRLMTNEPWRSHGAALDATGAGCSDRARGDAGAGAGEPRDRCRGRRHWRGGGAHPMSRLPGLPTAHVDDATAATMAEMLVQIHDVRPAEPFREYPVVGLGSEVGGPGLDPDAWARAFDMLAEEPPAFDPTFLHRDFGHRNLLWLDGRISRVVDWVETSTGPAWLDAAHAATNLAVAYGPAPATSFLSAYAALTGSRPERYWLVMDAVGFLPPPGQKPFFDSAVELERLDDWLQRVVSSDVVR